MRLADGSKRVDGPLFGEHLHSGTPLLPGQRVGVALSGGLDSTVLLHLLRFAVPGHDLDVRAVHVDHAMRPESAEDARWVTGLCTAWGVPLSSERADHPPSTEEAARDLRYRVFEQVRSQWRLDWVLTAHHADDQAETVLFRAVRGTGLRGLAGIPMTRDGWLLRPLLPFTRLAIEDYANRHRIRWREDATNTDSRIRRNALRHSILPALERSVAPRARRALTQLADVAHQLESTVAGLADVALMGVIKHTEPSRIVLDGRTVANVPMAARSELLRAAARRLGGRLGKTGTRVAVQVSSPDFQKGSADLGRGIHLSVQYEDLVMERRRTAESSSFLTLGTEADGEGMLRLGGRSLSVRWSQGASSRESAERPVGGLVAESASFSQARLKGPLTVRSWLPGDRMRLSYGSKKMRRLFQEARMPQWRRGRQPLLVDSAANVLWAPGLRRSSEARPVSGEAAFRVVIDDSTQGHEPTIGGRS